MTIEIYTDGSAHYVSRFGAWAFVAVYPDGKEVPRSGAAADTTNNRMELSAVCEAIDFILSSGDTENEFKIVTDSEYVCNGLNTWRKSWRLKNWKNVKNSDIWIPLDAAVDTAENLGFKVTITWVKGHNGNKYNEVVDKLAHAAFKKISEENTLPKKETE